MKKRNISSPKLSSSNYEREATGWQLLPSADFDSSKNYCLPPPPNAEGDLEMRGGPCTITIRRRIEEEKIELFKEWQKGITEANQLFDGFEGATLLQESVASDDGDRMFHVILK